MVNGIVTTLAGTDLRSGFSGDCGPGREALLSRPAGLTVHDGVLYVVDAGNNRIRMVLL